MSIFKDVTKAIVSAEGKANDIVEEVGALILEAEMDGPGVRLGLGPQRNVNRQPARPGDIILRVEVDGTLVPFVVSNVNGEEPLARNKKRGEEIAIRPELLVIGAMTNNPQLKAAAGRMSTKYPDRRVFLYGDTKQKKEKGLPEPRRAAIGHGNANPRMK